MILEPAQSLTLALARLALKGGTFGQQAGYLVAQLEADGFEIVRKREPHSPRHLQVFVIVRIDSDMEDIESAVTIKEILPTLAEAREEVERLMQTAPAGALYAWQTARYLPNGQSGQIVATYAKEQS